MRHAVLVAYLVLLGSTLALVSCAAKAAPSLPASPKYPEFVYPTTIPASAPQAAAVDRGWRFLQNDDLKSADKEFATALKTDPMFAAARTGEGYVALARKDYTRAVQMFDRALRGSVAYAPALVGKGMALLSLDRDDEARAALEAAMRADGSLTSLAARIDVLKFREIQSIITAARQASAAGRLDEARGDYQRAIAATPDSAALYRELGVVERRRGDMDAALASFDKAVALDAADAVALAQKGEILEERGDFAGAETAFRTAQLADPSSGYEQKADEAAAKGREARLPPEFRELPTAARITRGDLAALIGIRMDQFLRSAPRVPVVTTDTRGHWASGWIAEVAGAGIMAPFDNHTFQPNAVVRRVDLAVSVHRALIEIARTHPALQARIAERPAIADVGPSHLNYADVAAAVSAGVLPLLEGGRFDIEQPVSGAEAIAAVDRLRALAAAR
jgi:tetratricopeptide (TPR) repeat protein